ncbi:MAG: IS3 family transposase, partial [Lawsonibacter sp.]|nr:IS3 family transposase [Lawsonibacter sp.]
YIKLNAPEKKRNILRQQFQADRPNQIWVSDVTCFKLGERYLYTCVILDLFSRKIVAYNVSKKNSTQLITSTFKIAWEQRSPNAGLIFHSDRGAQYTSHRFRQLLHERSAEQSFSNSEKPHDNAVAESFFAALKKEDLYRKDYTSEAVFKRGLASYIEFNNTQRPHRTLKNQTPCQVEELFMSGNQ